VSADTPTSDRAVYPAAVRIRDLPPDLQPRELLERFGPAHVPDDVLLAVLLRTGMRGRNVLDLARDLLRQHRSLADLSRASLTELASIKSIKRVKALTLIAAFELGRRVRDEQLRDRPAIRSPEDVDRTVRPHAERETVEVFWVLPLNKKNRLIPRHPIEITRGILDASLVHPREVFEPAIRACSAAVILCHNHPSGDPTPSADDLAMTRRLIAAGRAVDIRVLDHVILGRAAEADSPRRYCSLRESGLISFEDLKETL